MTISRLIVLCALLHMDVVHNSHFRGGTITWRPLSNNASSGTVDILIRQRYSWRRSAAMCTDPIIAARGYIGDYRLVTCVSGDCMYWSNNMYTTTYCTDFNVNLDVSSGEKYETRTYPLNIQLSIAFESCCWFGTLTWGANGNWNIVSRISTFIRPDGYINTSPVAVTLPIIYKEINIQHAHVVQMSDFDSTDTLKCRWSSLTANYNEYNECGNICSGLASAFLISENCTIVFTLSLAGWYSAVALQIEDFYNSTATVPMSSVPLQFLFYGYANPGGCSTPPAIIGNRPNRACIGTPIGSNVTEYVVVQVYCAGKTIVDFVTSSPVGMTKSAILNPTPGIYHLILSWIPTGDQYGPQGFCAGAIDNTDLQSNQWCITFLVGFHSPDVIRPKMVQGSASPIGTILQNHTIFSIQTTKSVSRPKRNGTFIYFWDATAGDTLVAKFDCGWAPEVTYTGLTTVVYFPVAPWIPAHFYYVTFDSGVASGKEFCGPESAPVTDKTFWVFNIWDPAVSSTTTTTTTPPTTGTVTTRSLSTSSINTLLTTTGIVIITTVPPTTTTTTSSTQSTSTTTTATTRTTPSTASTVAVLYPDEIDSACQQPIVIMTIAGIAAMIPIKILVMVAAFTKFSNTFNPSKKRAQLRHKQRLRNLNRR